MARYIAIVVIIVGAVVAHGQDTSRTKETTGVSHVGERKTVVAQMTINSAIGPITTREIRNALRQSERIGAEALVIELNTPGGQMESTWDIIQTILAAPVPVIVYVYPPGSRAASAGVFITYAAHIAAMAPQTNIGSAHPVGTGGAEIDSTMSEKVTNDAVAKIKTVAKKRGRNLEWAEDAVRKSVSITEFEALEKNVVDYVADDLDDLLLAVDQDTVELITGDVILRTSNAEVHNITKGFANQILEIISDPNIAYILMAIGMLGLYFELANPGAILPGVIGGISLIVALFSFQALPINFAGVLLLVLAMILFLLEIKIISHGILGGGGVISLFLGSLMLVNDTQWPYKGISLSVIVPTVLVFTLFFFLAAYMALRTHRRKVTTGQAGLQGETGLSKTEIGPAGGTVHVHGELWKAVSDANIEANKKVRVVDVQGMTLKVEQI
jgi:membrane-bound serine protease (ClpP class)